MDPPSIPRERSLTEVHKILSSAKLNINDLVPTSQALFFPPPNEQAKTYQLLELNNELLKNIEDNCPLFIKGFEEDDLVICSETLTFHVTSTETSNNLLLMTPTSCFNDIKDNTEENVKDIKICGIFQSYLESKIGKSSLNRLYEILKSTAYRGPEFEHEIDNTKLYTVDQLKNVIQSSDAELLDVLSTMDVFEIRGHIREIAFEYHFRVLSYMLKLIEENSWALDTIDYHETSESLKTIVPQEIISCLFKRYTTESKIVDGVQMYKYDEEKVCRFFARVLLRTAGRFGLDDFLQAWRESVPEGMTTNEDVLCGIAIVNRKSIPNFILAFEEDNLPDNITDRFQVLFDVKDKWTVPEIAPYIRRLATNKLDVNALLAKHARASKEDGVKYYSAKHK